MPSAIGLAQLSKLAPRSGITYLAEIGKGIAPRRRRVFREDVAMAKGATVAKNGVMADVNAFRNYLQAERGMAQEHRPGVRPRPGSLCRVG